MFKIIKEKFGKFIKYKLVNLITNESVSIIPDFGGNVNELVLKKNNNLYSVIDGFKNYNELIKHHLSKSAKLIPFPNRINNGVYNFNKKEYSLNINFPSQNHAIHGLVYNKKFKVAKKTITKSKVSLTIIYNGKGLTGYPFNFETNITYILNSKGFECKTNIVNKDKVKIPVGDGWHPYFKFDNFKIDDLYLKIPSKNKISVNNLMIPTGKLISVNKFSKLTKINNQNFDTGFVVNKNNSNISLISIFNKKLDVSINFWQETGKNKYNYVQVFIPLKRNSIAIEPMTCMTNAFNNKKGLIILKPKEKFSASYGVNLK